MAWTCYKSHPLICREKLRLVASPGTGSHLLRLSGTDMSIKASFPGQDRFIVKNRISRNRVLRASKGNNQGAYGSSCVPPWSRQQTELKHFILILNILPRHSETLKEDFNL